MEALGPESAFCQMFEIAISCQQPPIGAVSAADGTGFDAVLAESDDVPDVADGSACIIRRLRYIHVVWFNAWQAPAGFGCLDN